MKEGKAIDEEEDKLQ